MTTCTEGQEFFQEKDGIVIVEAEAFHSQERDDVRKWYIQKDMADAYTMRDIDSSHHHSASGGAYLEILPDTRTNHDEKLIKGENFINEPGQIGVLHYQVQFENTGRYYVWVRAYSTGTEDNGIHVGIDGTWPESGQRMQWCEGKHQWTWESKQRTKEEHCGVPRLIYLEIDQPGKHTISFSMREDGFEIDQWMMSKEYSQPD
ncbi:MAG: hypothetical protein HKN87_10940 [Saprospiraceae bacterium]|nr:hypothetical protein [Saprospiraceae bacterium]